MVNYTDCYPVTRKKLIEFTDEIERNNPGIKIDYTHMNKLSRENLWFIEILQDKKLK